MNKLLITKINSKATNVEMDVTDIYIKIRKKEIYTISIKTKEDKFARDFNYLNFLDEFKQEIITGLVLIAEEQKEKQFKNFRYRQNNFTSDSSISNVDVEFYDEGIYLIISGIRCKLKTFINNEGKVIRKPRNINIISKMWFKTNC